MKMKILSLIILSFLSVSFINSMDLNEPLLDDAEEEDIHHEAPAHPEAAAIAEVAPPAPALPTGFIALRLPQPAIGDFVIEAGEFNNKLKRIFSCKGLMLCGGISICALWILIISKSMIEKYKLYIDL